ncbi:MltA-interacting protein [plant metagenome]|uniref:MltA-interacting protein n=1 Tax=plant metagenome TaxID=1297885 RepID=A0A484UDX1_9ZZZZ
MIKFLCPVLACSLSFTALAQEGSGGGPDDHGPPRWGLGLAAVVTDSPYAGEGTRVMPIPLVSYHGERFYFEGLGAGWVFLKNDSFELAAVAKGRMDGFDVKDLGRSELARNGVDYRLLDDRDMGLDLGAKVKWSGRGGELEAELLADATDTSGGQEFSLQYGYGFDLGKGRLTPNAGVTWQSKDMANYYYGTLKEEVARGVVDYKPGAVTIPHVGVSYFRPLGENWMLMGFAQYKLLPDKITDSPLIERDTSGSATLFIGLSRGF